MKNIQTARGIKMRPNHLALELVFGKEEILVSKSGSYHSVALRRGGSEGRAGDPALPWRKFLVFIPHDAHFRGVTFNIEETATLVEGVVVEPIQPNVPTPRAHGIPSARLAAALKPFGPDPEIYSSKAAWPPIPLRFAAVRRIGGMQLVELEVCPFQYLPARKRLDLVLSMAVEIEFHRSTASPPSFPFGQPFQQQIVEYLKNVVVNPGSLPPGGLVTVLPSDSPHLIITSRALVPAFQALADWRTQNGLSSTVVAVEDIQANSVPNTADATFWMSSGYVDGGTRDLPEAVRNFIKWAAANWRTKYVLLGADVSAIPMRLCFVSRTGYSYVPTSPAAALLGEILGVAAAYSIAPDTTRIYLGPTPPLYNLLAFLGWLGSTAFPYNASANDANPGWYFVDNLESGVQVAGPTDVVELRGPNLDAYTTFYSMTLDNRIPTDLYYADLDSSTPAGQHDWDANGNGIYGEQLYLPDGVVSPDGVNLLAAVHVGRISVAKTTDAQAWVNKVMHYEQYQDPFGNGLPPDFAVNALLWSAAWWEGTPSQPEGSMMCNDAIGQMLLEQPDGWQLTRLYESLAELPPTSDPARAELLTNANKDAVTTAAIGIGNNLCSFTGHGILTSIGDYNSTPFIHDTDIKTITNQPGIWYANACLTNCIDRQWYPQWATYTTLSEWAVRNPYGGAVAYMGNTRDGYTGDGPKEKAFWDEMLTSGLLGPMLEAAHMAGDAWFKYSMNLMGDPAMPVWNSRPAASYPFPVVPPRGDPENPQ